VVIIAIVIIVIVIIFHGLDEICALHLFVRVRVHDRPFEGTAAPSVSFPGGFEPPKKKLEPA
jgi:hypothetical protein